MSWVAVAIGGAAVIGGGVAMYEGSQNRSAQLDAEGKFNVQPDYLQLPGYAESDAARGDWWKTLQENKASGSWGVNMPNYDKVYENAQNRINQYYWGGPSGGGLIDKIRAGAARRGVADSPATDVLTQRMGAEQSGKLGDISTSLDVTKANAVETARGNWMNSLTNLAALKPSYVSGKTGQFSSPSMTGAGAMIANAGMGAAQIYGQNQQNQDYMQFLKSLQGDQLNPTQTQSSLTSSGGSYLDGTKGFGSELGYA